MTTLETILLLLIWVSYGSFAAYQTEISKRLDDTVGIYFIYVAGAPIVFIIKCLYGAFKRYKNCEF